MWTQIAEKGLASAAFRHNIGTPCACNRVNVNAAVRILCANCKQKINFFLDFLILISAFLVGDLVAYSNNTVQWKYMLK